MSKTYFPLLFLILSFGLKAQSYSSGIQTENLDSIVQLIQQSYDIPGLAIGIIKENKIYSKGFGVQDIKTNKPLNPKSNFHMASVSKPFAATAILQLVEKGQLNLDDKLIEILPYFRMKDKRFKDITIKHILNHSSGIPDVKDYEWDKPQMDVEAAERYTKSFVDQVLDFEPNTSFSYSNAAYNILADVIAKVSGLSFEEYMTQEIFEPLGMKHSSFFKPDIPASIATEPHTLNDELQMEIIDVYPYNRIHAPSSTLNSNVEDMLKWGQAYLNKGKIGASRIISEKTYELLTTPTIKLNETRQICLGWFTTDLDGKTIYYHSGGDEGYRTFFGFLPDEKMTIVLMGNNDYFKSAPAAVYLVKKLLIDSTLSWKIPIIFKLKDLILTEGIENCKAFYKNAQQNFSDEYDLTGRNLDRLGYWLLERNKNQEALNIFLFNVELFPEEAGFYDSVGDAYLEMDKKGKAIEWYEKALAINPNQDFTIEKLEKLKN